jgi:hypothetical protein
MDLFDDNEDSLSVVEDAALLFNWLWSGCAKAGLRELKVEGYAFPDEGLRGCAACSCASSASANTSSTPERCQLFRTVWLPCP